MGDPRVSKLAEKVIKNEIKPALLLENPNSKQYINSFTQSFLKRCRASFKDSCSRVGRDPMRKLQAGERVIGAIKLSQKHNLTTKGLEFGAACAIMYSLLLTNENDDETQKIKEIYQKRHSIEDVLTYNGEYNKSKYAGLNPNDDHELITRIKENFETLKKELNQNDI
jgi:mannitol-1-phosphate/altronate dehydrogenase